MSTWFPSWSTHESVSYTKTRFDGQLTNNRRFDGTVACQTLFDMTMTMIDKPPILLWHGSCCQQQFLSHTMFAESYTIRVNQFQIASPFSRLYWTDYSEFNVIHCGVHAGRGLHQPGSMKVGCDSVKNYPVEALLRPIHDVTDPAPEEAFRWSTSAAKSS